MSEQSVPNLVQVRVSGLGLGLGLGFGLGLGLGSVPNQPVSQRHQPCTQVPWPEQPLKQSFSQPSSHAGPYAPSTHTQLIVLVVGGGGVAVAVMVAPPSSAPPASSPPFCVPRPLPPPAELCRQRPRAEHPFTPHAASARQTASTGRASCPERPAPYALSTLLLETASPRAAVPWAA